MLPELTYEEQGFLSGYMFLWQQQHHRDCYTNPKTLLRVAICIFHEGYDRNTGTITVSRRRMLDYCQVSTKTFRKHIKAMREARDGTLWEITTTKVNGELVEIYKPLFLQEVIDYRPLEAERSEEAIIALTGNYVVREGDILSEAIGLLYEVLAEVYGSRDMDTIRARLDKAIDLPLYRLSENQIMHCSRMGDLLRELDNLTHYSWMPEDIIARLHDLLKYSPSACSCQQCIGERIFIDEVLTTDATKK